ncbi:hypothetical protein CCYA_CCYA13G3605 [Cyanidiococcus yangmingshanensis]|nr:hypothetical protein CCYA_CCYA13G3605 [Cyanidiococcus yangmingshanensis]
MFIFSITTHSFTSLNSRDFLVMERRGIEGRRCQEREIFSRERSLREDASRKRKRTSWRLSCTGQSDQYMKWLESTRRSPEFDKNAGASTARPLSYLEQLEQRRLQQRQDGPQYNSAEPKRSVIQNATSQSLWKRLFSLFGNMSTERGTALQKLRSYGLAAVLAYGIFDAITYTTSFVVALITFKRTTNNAPLTWQNLLKVVAGMWLLNNFSRPFRIAGALLLAPLVDRHVVKPLSIRFRGKQSASIS